MTGTIKMRKKRKEVEERWEKELVKSQSNAYQKDNNNDKKEEREREIKRVSEITIKQTDRCRECFIEGT